MTSPPQGTSVAPLRLEEGMLRASDTVLEHKGDLLYSGGPGLTLLWLRGPTGPQGEETLMEENATRISGPRSVPTSQLTFVLRKGTRRQLRRAPRQLRGFTILSTTKTWARSFHGIVWPAPSLGFFAKGPCYRKGTTPGVAHTKLSLDSDR